MPRWEYCVLTRSRDAQFDSVVDYWLWEPGVEGRRLEVPGPDGSGWLDILNRLGDLEWEVVGPPTQSKVAMTYQNKEKHYMKYADWQYESYILKRPKI